MLRAACHVACCVLRATWHVACCVPSVTPPIASAAMRAGCAAFPLLHRHAVCPPPAWYLAGMAQRHSSAWPAHTGASRASGNPLGINRRVSTAAPLLGAVGAQAARAVRRHARVRRRRWASALLLLLTPVPTYARCHLRSFPLTLIPAHAHSRLRPLPYYSRYDDVHGIGVVAKVNLADPRGSTCVPPGPGLAAAAADGASRRGKPTISAEGRAAWPCMLAAWVGLWHQPAGTIFRNALSHTVVLDKHIPLLYKQHILLLYKNTYRRSINTYPYSKNTYPYSISTYPYSMNTYRCLRPQVRRAVRPARRPLSRPPILVQECAPAAGATGCCSDNLL
jgi:hypothetical protein